MQITVKSVKILKKGTNDYGEWKLVKVTTDDEEYTTLAKEAEMLTPGTIINITDMDEDEKGKKFKKYEILEKGSETTPQPPPKVTESREKPIHDTNRSIARAVALKAAVDAEGHRIQSGGEPLSTKGVLGVAEKFEEWLTR